jgi:hypothetical protein
MHLKMSHSKFDNDIMTTNKLPGMYFFLTTIIFPIQNQYKSYLIKYCMHFHISNIKSFLPVEAEISVMKV